MVPRVHHVRPHEEGADVMCRILGCSRDDLPDGEGRGDELLTISTQLGTHVDAPLHDGNTCEGRPERTIGDIGLDELFVDSVVLGVREWARPGEAIPPRAPCRSRSRRAEVTERYGRRLHVSLDGAPPRLVDVDVTPLLDPLGPSSPPAAAGPAERPTGFVHGIDGYRSTARGGTRMATTEEPTRSADHATIDLAPFAGLVVSVVVVVLAATFASRLVEVVGLFLAAVALAVTTLPVQRRLAPLVGRVASLALTALASAVGTLTVVFLAVRDLAARTERIALLAERRLDDLAPSSLMGRVVRATRLDAGIEGWLDEVPSRFFLGGSGAAVATQVFLFLSVVVLAAFLQASGGAIVDWFVRRWPRETAHDDGTGPRREIRDLLRDIERRGVGAFRRLLALALTIALIVGGVAVAVDLPGAIVLGLWVGVWSVVPLVGPAVAVVPAVALLALDQRPVAWLVVGVVVVVVVGASVMRRRWIDPLVHVGAGPYVLAAAAGVAIAGVGGSIVALLAVCCLIAVATSSSQPASPPPWRVPSDATWTVSGVTMPTGWRLVVLAASASFVAALAWVVLAGLGRGLAWLLVGGFVAVALSRPVGWVADHTRLERRTAAALVCVVVATVIFAAAMTGADDGARATTTLTERLPSIVAGMEDIPVIGDWLEQREASVWIDEQMNDLPQRVRTGRPADWLPFFGERLVDLFWVCIIAIALLVDGKRMVDHALGLVPARHRRQWIRVVGATGTALGGYAAGAAFVAAINASVIFGVAVVLGLGVAPALALWGFLWNFVPQIGGFMGGLPLVVFALVLGPLQGLFAALVFIAYQFVENHLIQPAIVGAAIEIAPWGTLLAAIAGAAAAGIVGAIVLTPLVGVIGVIRRDLARDDFPGAVAQATETNRMLSAPDG